MNSRKKIGSKIIGIILFQGLLSASCFSQNYIITNYAGLKHYGFTGDGGPAYKAHLANPVAVFVDDAENLFISDWGNSRVRVIDQEGIINTIAGNGVYGFSGDGGPATDAELNGPMGIYEDKNKNIFVADIGNERIRKIDPNGIIITVAGNGVYGYSGDGGLAISASFEDPAGICGDASGNIYITDEFNNRIRKINTNGIISTLAGNGISGYSGDGGSAVMSELYYPAGVAIDNEGSILIADENNNCIRKVNPNGVISTIAGNGTAKFSGDGGQASSAGLYNPAGVGIDKIGNIFIADGFNNRIRKINGDGIISTIAGNGIAGYSGFGDTATLASIHDPVSVSVDASGNVFFATEYSSSVEKLSLISDAANTNASFLVYPNPNQGIFTIKVENNTESLHLEAFTILGQKIADIPLNSTETQINLSAFSKGIYFYRVTTDIGQVLGTGKVIIY